MKREKIVLGIFVALAVVFIAMLVNCLKNYKRTYDYEIKGKIYQSNKCYLREEIPVCESKNKIIEVNWYSEVER